MPRPRLQIPSNIIGEAAVEWGRIVRELRAEGLTPDRGILTLYCEQYRQWSEAQAKLAENGTVIKMPNGWPNPNPFGKVVAQTTKQMASLLEMMGLTDSARRRKKKHEEKPAENEDF